MPSERVKVRLVEHPRGGYALRADEGTHRWVCEVSVNDATFTNDPQHALRFLTVDDVYTAVVNCHNLTWVGEV